MKEIINVLTFTAFAKMNKELFDENTVFQFYSKSSGKSPPGKGAGEKVQENDTQLYEKLLGIPNWRRILSNFWIAPFDLDGHRWQSVEHFYHASKFKQGNPDFYLSFTIDQGEGQLPKEPAMAKGVGGVTGKFKGKQIRPSHVVMDRDFFSSGKNKIEMERAQQAKYEQNPLAKRVLLATKNAKLQHFVRGGSAIVFYDTMRVREKLRLNKFS